MVNDGLNEFWGDFKVVFHWISLFVQYLLILSIPTALIFISVMACIIYPVDEWGYWTLILTVPVYMAVAYASMKNSHLNAWIFKSRVSQYLKSKSSVWAAVC